MPIGLTTGVPGAGKTLLTVSEVLQVYLKSPVPRIGSDGRPAEPINRRLMIGGIPDLLLDHEPITVEPIDAEWVDPWASHVRLPGQPPLDVEHRVENWWLWCKPGDVICVDECQRVFRPMPSGRRIPAYIAKLETHRHYGIDFELITQHPQLLHVNVRNLIGRHRHVRRLFGGGGTVVYEWDHCANPVNTKNATKRIWRHAKSAFKLYKSSELHTKHRHPLGFALWIFFAAVLAFPAVLWWGYERFKVTYGIAAAEDAAAAAPAPRSGAVTTAHVRGVDHATPTTRAVAPAPLPAAVIDGGYCAGSQCVCFNKAGFRYVLSDVACAAYHANAPLERWRLQAAPLEGATYGANSTTGPPERSSESGS